MVNTYGTWQRGLHHRVRVVDALGVERDARLPVVGGINAGVTHLSGPPHAPTALLPPAQTNVVRGARLSNGKIDGVDWGNHPSMYDELTDEPSSMCVMSHAASGVDGTRWFATWFPNGCPEATPDGEALVEASSGPSAEVGWYYRGDPRELTVGESKTVSMHYIPGAFEYDPSWYSESVPEYMPAEMYPEHAVGYEHRSSWSEWQEAGADESRMPVTYTDLVIHGWQGRLPGAHMPGPISLFVRFQPDKADPFAPWPRDAFTASRGSHLYDQVVYRIGTVGPDTKGNAPDEVSTWTIPDSNDYWIVCKQRTVIPADWLNATVRHAVASGGVGEPTIELCWAADFAGGVTYPMEASSFFPVGVGEFTMGLNQVRLDYTVGYYSAPYRWVYDVPLWIEGEPRSSGQRFTD